MSAVDTVQQVLRWAIDPDGPPPQGDLFDLNALLDSDTVLQEALSRSASVSAARLGLTGPSLEDGNPLSADALLIAAAIGSGVFHPAEAVELARCAAMPESNRQLALHHGLVSPALLRSFLPLTLCEELLARSPLTAVLYLPPEGGEDIALGLCERLASCAEGRRLLVHGFSDPMVNSGQLSWRGRVMADMRLEDRFRPLVLDIYEAAIALHGFAWRQRIDQAMHILGLEKPTKQETALVLSVARWWDPLRALYKSHHQSIRERNYLEFQLYLAGIRFAAMVDRWTKGLR